jgi:hypothetical protein
MAEFEAAGVDLLLLLLLRFSPQYAQMERFSKAVIRSGPQSAAAL